MTRDEAVSLIRSFFQSLNVDSPGLNDKNLGGAAIGDLQIFFEYQPARAQLKCSAHIYSFKKEPRAEILSGFASEEAKGTDTGGGFFEYQPENKGIYLSRTYSQPVNNTQFTDDLKRLLEASRHWGGEVLERVSAAAFGN